ncbi:Regulator of MON1-CCZ1 complex-like protein [Drosera capensis]
MFGEASTSLSSAGSGGSGALSHVFIKYPPMRCDTPGSKGLFYDDVNKLLLSPTADQVLSWKVVAPFILNAMPLSDPIAEGSVLSIHYSLDGKILAIQRSSHDIQFWNKETQETFRQRCRPESESILGFFWTDCLNYAIVFVKTRGLDLFSYDPEMTRLRLVESKRLNVTWYRYTHESRLVLLASGSQCKTCTGFPLSSAGVVRLPKFEMMMAKSEANNKPVLAAEDIHIITVYGRIYCFQVDSVAMLLHSYRFYRDAVVPQGSLPIYSSKIVVSVVDSVLLVHQVDAKVIILYDIFADSRAPISAPLPLLLRDYPRFQNATLRLADKDASVEEKEVNIQEPVLYGDAWSFLVPDLICDTVNGLLWKVRLDLEAISASSSEVSSVLVFLQRRKLEAMKAKQLCLAITRTIILERRPVSIVSKALDVLITSYSLALKNGSYLKGIKSDKASASSDSHTRSSRIPVDESFDAVPRVKSARTEFYTEVGPAVQSSIYSSSDSEEEELPHVPGYSITPLDGNVPDQQESHISSSAISPDDIYCHVLAPVDDKMAGDPAYLVAILVEFLCKNAAFSLGLFIIIEPSKEVAYQLLESGRQNLHTRKFGIDMLRQLALHNATSARWLLSGARLQKVTAIRPSLFLEAAYSSNDPQHLAAVLRFLSDFIPSFKSTSDYAVYCRVLSDTTTSIAA